jgi:hypothetical protein
MAISFKALSDVCPEGLRKISNNLSQDSRSPRRHMNPGRGRNANHSADVFMFNFLKPVKSVLKGSDDGILHLKESYLWNLSIVHCFS